MMKRGAQEEKEVVRGVGDVTSAQRHEREKAERKREREKGDDENGGNDVRRQKVGERERRANVKFFGYRQKRIADGENRQESFCGKREETCRRHAGTKQEEEKKKRGEKLHDEKK